LEVAAASSGEIRRLDVQIVNPRAMPRASVNVDGTAGKGCGFYNNRNDQRLA